MTTTPFKEQILAMNTMYKLDIRTTPELPKNSSDRLTKFKKTLMDEVLEIDEIVTSVKAEAPSLEVLTALADLLADVIVYCRSEALKYGLPLEEVLEIVMESNQSKLDINGKPIYDVNGKFLKGPNYWKPEPRIAQLLKEKMEKI